MRICGEHIDNCVPPELSPMEAAAATGMIAREGFWRKHFVSPFVTSDNEPWFDARGVAVGVFLGLGIPLGFQMAVLGLLRLLVKFNSALAFLFTWVNNPFTLIPLYYGYYRLGSALTGKPITLSVDAFRAMLKPVTHADYFWQSASSFMYLGREVLIRWSIGAIVSASVLAAAAYVISYAAQKARWRKRIQEDSTEN